MQKKAVKNFVYSFLFSLLAVAAVGKVFFRAPETPKDQTGNKVIKTQDISLFSKPKDLAAPISSAPVVDVSAIDALTAPAPAAGPLPVLEHKPEIMAENIVTATSKKVVKNSINTDLAAAQEIVLEPEVITAAQISKPDYEQSGIVYADISDTLQDEKTQNTISEPAKVLYAPEGADVTPIENNITVADNTALSVTPIEDEDIPLLETSGTLHKQIEVQNSASGTEIAMLEPNTLVNTIEDAEAPEEKTLAEADLKQNEWKQMSEKQPEDSPWVVAKGNRFAKNKAVVEQFADKTIAAPAPIAAETPAEEPAEKQIEEPIINEEPTVEPAVEETAPETVAPEAPASTDTEETLQSAAKEEQITLALNPETANKAGAETKVAYQMVPNLLIPIPDDIANDPNLTPQLSYSPDDKPAKKEEIKEPEAAGTDENNLNEDEKKTGLFKSITSWFAGNKDKNKDEASQTEMSQSSTQTKSTFDFFGVGNKFPGQSKPAKILPAELRLSFQPNRAEISGQTLRWIHAFADNARDNDDLYIEIRIDGTSSFALQKKRLNLLSTILANRGVDYRKINIVFTSREPNSFIIRNIRFNNKEEVVVNKDNDNSYYRPW
jgi:hypothetical protein